MQIWRINFPNQSINKSVITSGFVDDKRVMIFIKSILYVYETQFFNVVMA